MVEIRPADLADADEIWNVQQAAFLPEAEVLHNSNTYSLRQTVDGVKEDFGHGPVLKAVNEKGEIVGSVRAQTEPTGTVLISKLVVRPDCQRQGIGTRLLHEIESLFPSDNLRLGIVYAFTYVYQFYETEGYVKGGRDSATTELGTAGF
jgi:ribosomal protein S18 acetylase RimI-like enzyme